MFFSDCLKKTPNPLSILTVWMWQSLHDEFKFRTLPPPLPHTHTHLIIYPFSSICEWLRSNSSHKLMISETPLPTSLIAPLSTIRCTTFPVSMNLWLAYIKQTMSRWSTLCSPKVNCEDRNRCLYNDVIISCLEYCWITATRR